MKAHGLLVLTCVVAACALAATRGGADPDDKTESAIADKLVTYCAGVKKGDLIQISGTFKQQAMLEHLAVAVRKQGAFPLLTVGSTKLAQRLILEVPAKFDTQPVAFDHKLADIITAQLSLEDPEFDNFWPAIPPARLASYMKANADTSKLQLKRNIRMVSLGNGLYPSKDRAKAYGLSEDALKKLFLAGVNVDYAKMQATGARVQKILAGGKELHLTHANGTDLKVKLAEPKVFVSDGIITPERQKQGGPACQVWLPAGEVYFVPALGTAEGKFVCPHFFWDGKEVPDLTLTLKGGKLTAMTAKSGLKRVQEVYAAAMPGKDMLSVIDLGINGNVQLGGDARLAPIMAAGTVSICVGDNTWVGGDNNTGFGIIPSLRGATLTVDGQTIIENGALKLPRQQLFAVMAGAGRLWMIDGPRIVRDFQEAEALVGAGSS